MKWGTTRRAASSFARKVCACGKSVRVLLPKRPLLSSEAASGLFFMFWSFMGVALSMRWLIVTLLKSLGHRLVVWPL